MASNTDGSGVCIPFPLPEQRLFRNQAVEDILLLLLRNVHSEFSVTELRAITGHGGDTVQTALDVCEAAQLITTRREGRKKLVAANRDRFFKPDDPLLAIPQEAFREPVRVFVERVLEREEDNLVGVVLFGSVARGEADRASDIDIQVIVEGGLTSARRELHDVRQEVEGRRFRGERYAFHLLVESVETATSYAEKLQDIFSQGIVLYSTDRMEEVREVVFGGG